MSGKNPQTAVPGTAGLADFCGLELSGGRYVVQSKLGEGSMGIVYLAYDHHLETEVVIKVPTAATLNDPEFAERFQRETRSLVKLKHPHIVTIHDVGAFDGVPFVVMQYLPGGNLRDRLNDANGRSKPVSVERLQDWLPAIAKALDFIHKQGFLHRDVKPANILFDEHGHAYLSDFGLAKAVSSAAATPAARDASLTAAGFLVGTPNYVAPELVMGHEHDGRVDQYSLAMTAYEAVAGTVPVEGPTASATMVNQTSMKIPPVSQYVPGFPDAVTEVLLRGLAKNQKKRFESCTAFADAVTSAGRPASSKSQKMSGGKLSRAVAPGKIPCPECGKVLPLKPQFAGKRARCGQCLHMLLIGDDLKTLRVIGGPPPKSKPEETLAEAPITNRNRKGARETIRNESSHTSRQRLAQDGDIGALLGDEAFGMKLGPKLVLGILLSTIVLLMSAAGVAVWSQSRIELQKLQQEAKANALRDTERNRPRTPSREDWD